MEYPDPIALMTCFLGHSEGLGKYCKVDQFESMVRELNLPISNKRISEITKIWKESGKTEFDYDEFHTLTQLTEPQRIKLVTMRGAFKCFDTNGDGYVDFDFLKVFLAEVGNGLSPEEIENAMHALKVDKFGRVDINSACAIFLHEPEDDDEYEEEEEEEEEETKE